MLLLITLPLGTDRPDWILDFEFLSVDDLPYLPARGPHSAQVRLLLQAVCVSATEVRPANQERQPPNKDPNKDPNRQRRSRPFIDNRRQVTRPGVGLSSDTNQAVPVNVYATRRLAHNPGARKHRCLCRDCNSSVVDTAFKDQPTARPELPPQLHPNPHPVARAQLPRDPEPRRCYTTPGILSTAAVDSCCAKSLVRFGPQRALHRPHA